MIWYARDQIAHAIGVVNRFLSNPGKEHWLVVKWIFRYLSGISKLCLCFGKDKLELSSFAELGDDVVSRKSTSGFLNTFARGAVS